MDKCLLKCYIYFRMVFGMKLYRDYLFLFFILFVSIIERTFCIWIFHTVITLKGVNSVKVGFIGAGKVGFSLGKYLKEQGYMYQAITVNHKIQPNRQQILQTQKSITLLKIF